MGIFVNLYGISRNMVYLVASRVCDSNRRPVGHEKRFTASQRPNFGLNFISFKQTEEFTCIYCSLCTKSYQRKATRRIAKIYNL